MNDDQRAALTFQTIMSASAVAQAGAISTGQEAYTKLYNHIRNQPGFRDITPHDLLTVLTQPNMHHLGASAFGNQFPMSEMIDAAKQHVNAIQNRFNKPEINETVAPVMETSGPANLYEQVQTGLNGMAPIQKGGHAVNTTPADMQPMVPTSTHFVEPNTDLLAGREDLDLTVGNRGKLKPIPGAEATIHAMPKPLSNPQATAQAVQNTVDLLASRENLKFEFGNRGTHAPATVTPVGAQLDAQHDQLMNTTFTTLGSLGPQKPAPSMADAAAAMGAMSAPAEFGNARDAHLAAGTVSSPPRSAPKLTATQQYAANYQEPQNVAFGAEGGVPMAAPKLAPQRLAVIQTAIGVPPTGVADEHTVRTFNSASKAAGSDMTFDRLGEPATEKNAPSLKSLAGSFVRGMQERAAAAPKFNEHGNAPAVSAEQQVNVPQQAPAPKAEPVVMGELSPSNVPNVRGGGGSIGLA